MPPDTNPVEPVSKKTGLKLGPLSSVCLIAILVYQLVLRDAETELGHCLWLATLWAGWAISTWILVRQPISVFRAVLLGLSLGWHCLLLSIVREQPAERYLLFLGCYGLMQAVASILFNLPTFRFPHETSAPDRGKPQFGILTISVVTTGMAIVMYAAKRYADIKGGDFFTSTVLIMASLLLVFIVAIVTSNYFINDTLLWLALGVGSTVLTATVAAALMLAFEDLLQGPLGIAERESRGNRYFLVVTCFGVIVHFIGICGKLDAKLVLQKQA